MPFPSYMSNSNMSNIQESIQEESMKFQNSQQAISEMISISKTGKNVSMSKASKNPNQKKSLVNITQKNNKQKFNSEKQIIEQENLGQKQNQNYLNEQNRSQEPVFLGQNVFLVIKERYKQSQGNETSDPNVLFEFFKRQRKTMGFQNNLKINDLSSLMPSAQRKIMIKMQFQKILTYYPQDVYYTLVCGFEKQKKDLQIQKKRNKLNNQFMKRPSSKKKNIQQVVDRLYCGNKAQSQILKKQPTQISQRQKRRQFGNRLRQVYSDQYKSNKQPPLQTADKMHQFWEDQYQRDTLNIQWDQQTVKQTIRLYMAEQVQDILIFFQRKLGFKQLSGPDMFKFYKKNMPIQDICIPLSSFKQYLMTYNQIIKEKQDKMISEHQKMISQKQINEKKKQVKKYGRPVSATPISILSKPKTAANFGDLAQKYSKDKFLGTLLHADKMKVARHAFEYGIYNLEQEVKIKGRIKPNQKENFDKTVFNLLNSTYTNKNFYNVKNDDRVRSILDQQDIEKNQTWNQLNGVLQQSLLVNSYEKQWYRESLLRFSSKTIKKDFKLESDKVLISEIIKYLSSIPEDQRKNQLNRFYDVINDSQQIFQKQQQIAKLSQKGLSFQLKQKRLFYSFLEEKACEYIQNRVKGKQINLRNFLNQIFATSLKEHKQFVTKYFHVVTGQKQCPKLLKYQFYRLQKQINPFTKQKDEMVKCHAWIPTKCTPQNFNYKTFNSFANVYQKDKNKIVAKPQKQSYKQTIWGYDKKKIKERQALMMTYNDAKQCVFHPKISIVK